MADPGIVNYIKEQSHAGYTDEEIEEALRDAGWSQKDIDDAFFVVFGKAEPIEPKKEQDAGKDEARRGHEEYISPWDTPDEEKGKWRGEYEHEPEWLPPAWETNEAAKEPEKQPPARGTNEGAKDARQAEPKAGDENARQVEQAWRSEAGKPLNPEAGANPQMKQHVPRIGATLSLVGGLLVLANFTLVNLLGMKDLMLMILYTEITILSALTPEMARVITLAAGLGPAFMGMLLFMKPHVDLYAGVAAALLGLGAVMCGNGYMIGGLVSIAGGSFAIIRK